MRYLAMRAARRTRILGTDSKDTLEQLALRRKSNAITLSRQVDIICGVARLLIKLLPEIKYELAHK
jgi:hypothetical protein